MYRRITRADAVEDHSCVDTVSKLSLDEQYTTDYIQWQDFSTRRYLSTAFKMGNVMRGGY